MIKLYAAHYLFRNYRSVVNSENQDFDLDFRMIIFIANYNISIRFQLFLNSAELQRRPVHGINGCQRIDCGIINMSGESFSMPISLLLLISVFQSPEIVLFVPYKFRECETIN